jgi:hypothetical protein
LARLLGHSVAAAIGFCALAAISLIQMTHNPYGQFRIRIRLASLSLSRTPILKKTGRPCGAAS